MTYIFKTSYGGQAKVEWRSKEPSPFFRLPRDLMPVAGTSRVLDETNPELYAPRADAVVFWHDTYDADRQSGVCIYRQQEYQPGGDARTRPNKGAITSQSA